MKTKLNTILSQYNYDLGCLRPWRTASGHSMITVIDRDPSRIVNRPAPEGVKAILTQAQWHEHDTEVAKAIRQKMKLTRFFINKDLVFNVPVPDAIGKLLVEPSLPDNGMERDYVPLPITHSDLMGTHPENTAASTQRVCEEIEEMVLGTDKPYTFCGKTIYGLTNNPERETRCVGDGDPILARAFSELGERRFHGPYICVTHPDREKISCSSSIPHKYETVSSYKVKHDDIIVLQATQDVFRVIVGLVPTLVQINDTLKVMAIVVPQIRKDGNGNTGIIHCQYDNGLAKTDMDMQS